MLKEFLSNPVNLKYTICYLIAVNIFGFLIMGIDKFKAKKGYWRTPEKTLFIVTLIGGGIGTVAGMYTFRHKTKKAKITIGLPTILISEICLVVYFIFFY